MTFPGIIRGIDIEKQVFYIVTPLSPDQLSSVIILFKSKLELPVHAMMMDTIRSESPYMTYISAEGVGSMARSTRSNLTRKRQMKNKPNP